MSFRADQRSQPPPQSDREDALRTPTRGRADSVLAGRAWLYTAAAGTGLLLICHIILASPPLSATGSVARRVERVTQLSGTIRHLDEVLTMSARMSAATGNPAWEAR